MYMCWWLLSHDASKDVSDVVRSWLPRIVLEAWGVCFAVSPAIPRLLQTVAAFGDAASKS